MKDLPQALRRRADLSEPSPWALRQAADEIERLTRERDEATRYLRNFLVSYVNKYCDPVPAWKPLENDLIGMLMQLDNASTVTGKFKRERDNLARERDEARAALSFYAYSPGPSDGGERARDALAVKGNPS